MSAMEVWNFVIGSETVVALTIVFLVFFIVKSMHASDQRKRESVKNEKRIKNLIVEMTNYFQPDHTPDYIKGEVRMLSKEMIKPKTAVDFYLKGYAYLMETGTDDNYVKSERHFEKAISKKYDFAEAYHGLGFAHHKLAQQKKNPDANYYQAIKNYQTATNIKPNYTNAYFNMGYAYRDIGESGKAVQSFQKAIGTADNFNMMGIMYGDISNNTLALHAYRQAIEIDPDHAEAYNNIGYTHQGLNQPDVAIPFYEKAIEIKSDFADAHYNLGIAYQDLGDQAKADECFKNAEKIFYSNLN